MDEIKTKIQTKPIFGFENYKISNTGIIFNKHGRKRRISLKNGGRYFQVILYKNGKSHGRLVHRLVLSAFCGPCPENMEANHKNGIRTDNRIENLEWVTKSENVKHAFRLGLISQIGMNNSNAKLKDGEVWLMKYLFKDGTISTKTISKMFLINYSHARSIKIGRFWKHIQA